MITTKETRHKALLALISREEISTQQELLERLRSEGFSLTQATVSRDIRELGLTKGFGSSGLCYRPAQSESESYGAGSRELFPRTVKRVECAANLAVIHTPSGLANAVATYIDSLRSIPILGCVAGDDTVLVVTPTNEAAEELKLHLQREAERMK
jgi:transcriptional regulator of arginine metabolism